MQNPDLVGGRSFFAFPLLDKILVMLDHDGDEIYQPMLIPIDGGFPEPTFEGFFESNYRVHLTECDPEKNIVYFGAERRDKGINEAYRGDLRTGELVKLDESVYGSFPSSPNEDHTRLMLGEGYSAGDVCYLANQLNSARKGKRYRPMDWGHPYGRHPGLGF
jgi:hypothetical protein